MSDHVPTIEPANREREAPAYRGACSCSWTAPTVRTAEGKGRAKVEAAKAEAQRDALNHAREANA